eukprot:CAMPEP_0181453972 /NCGR_PEP_ID=MMETSP1110-20121109/29999_1 /TAXON_ID=174948 /ORGANISM="Symbiodinium sp., Strain CCMP421" /LENGTH=122 /DNA_ID=CAMNT_0023578305 /DNA_START=511 /DNA_END=879 /DNA_ORIENTATION=+
MIDTRMPRLPTLAAAPSPPSPAYAKIKPDNANTEMVPTVPPLCIRSPQSEVPACRDAEKPYGHAVDIASDHWGYWHKDPVAQLGHAVQEEAQEIRRVDVLHFRRCSDNVNRLSQGGSHEEES